MHSILFLPAFAMASLVSGAPLATAEASTPARVTVAVVLSQETLSSGARFIIIRRPTREYRNVIVLRDSPTAAVDLAAALHMLRSALRTTAAPRNVSRMVVTSYQTRRNPPSGYLSRATQLVASLRAAPVGTIGRVATGRMVVTTP
ncbi:MAG: hypothetical protein HOP28_01170 [Gemmatimonadales bacterium]|nr:hypothetical protein [Gemmatimonadales bacterium]